ncbi:MAG: Ig-like domain-containing protein, partial [Sphingomicrobium sp.]
VAGSGVTYAIVGVGTGSYGQIQINADGSYTYTLTAPVDGDSLAPSQGGDNGTNSYTGIETFTYEATDANGNTVQGTIAIDVVDDVPTAIAPIALTIGLTNGGGDTSSQLLDADLDPNFGADGRGAVIFTADSITSLLGQGLTHNFQALSYEISGGGSTLTAFVNTIGTAGYEVGDTPVFTIQLEPLGSPDQYVVTMHNALDVVEEVDFGAGGYNFVGGNGNWAGFRSGTDTDGSLDLLLTPVIGGVSAGTVNTNANTGGISSGNSVGPGEGMRVDFVVDLTGTPQNGQNYEVVDPTSDHGYTSHQNVVGVSALFTAISTTATVRLEASDENVASDANNIVGDGVVDEITRIVIEYNGISLTVLKSAGLIQPVTVDGQAFTVTFGATDATVAGIVSDTRIGAFTADGLDSMIFSHGGGAAFSFKIGDFNTLALVQDPITFHVPVSIVDGDGDITAGANELVITAHPAGSPSGMAALDKQPANDDSSSLVASDNDDGSLQSSQILRAFQAANSNPALVGALAAAGLVSSHTVAAAHVADSGQVQANLTYGQAEHRAPAAPGTESQASTSVADLAQSQVEADADTVAVSNASAQQSADVAGIASETEAAEQSGPGELLQGTEAAATHATSDIAPAATTVAMPSAEMLAAATASNDNPQAAVDGNVGQVLADALAGGNSHGPSIDALLDSLPGGGATGHGATASLASLGGEHVPTWDMAAFAGFTPGHGPSIVDGLILHQDAPPQA